MGKSLRILTAGLLILAIGLGPARQALAQEASETTGAAKALELKQKLGLTDDQVSKLQAISASEKAEYTPLIQKGLADLKLLSDKIKAGAPDSEISPIIDSIEANRQAIEGAKTKYIVQVRAVLNPTQQGKVALAVAAVKLSVLQKLMQKRK